MAGGSMAGNGQVKEGKRTVQVNCWDFYHCPRERQLLCPAFTEDSGRACWSVAGTLCGGAVQGLNAKTIGSCERCDFYHQVKTSGL